MNKKPLVIIAGPTATGKSALAVELSKKINGEVISADSMQVYKGMDIGTAKISIDEMEGIKHYLIDILDPFEDFNIVTFKNLAKEAVSEIHSKGKVPVVCGGTGFYIQSLIKDIDFEETYEDDNYRNELFDFAKNNSNEALFEKLKEVDPDSCKILHPNDLRRVIRALEYYKITNTPISIHNEKEAKKESPYNFAYYVLDDDRKVIYEQIDKRVDLMMQNGLVDEVKFFVDKGLSMDNISMHGLGYKEIYSYLCGEITLDEAIYILKRDTRHFAKRQLTYFKREKETEFIDKRDYNRDLDKIIDYIISSLKEKSII